MRLRQVIKSLCSIPVIGGFITLLIALLPGLLVFPIPLEQPVKVIIFGLLVSAWCFFLAKKYRINITLPVLPIPFWGLGLLISASGAYQFIIN